MFKKRNIKTHYVKYNFPTRLNWECYFSFEWRKILFFFLEERKQYIFETDDVGVVRGFRKAKSFLQTLLPLTPQNTVSIQKNIRPQEKCSQKLLIFDQGNILLFGLSFHQLTLFEIKKSDENNKNKSMVLDNRWSPVAPLLEEINICDHWFICRKFNCEKLLFEVFLCKDFLQLIIIRAILLLLHF